jgi:hypothetical protein
MNPEAVNKYCVLMAEIKRRTTVAAALANRETHLVYQATTVEAIYLQYRKILELIALGSLVANKEVFSKMYRDFAKYWNAELLVKDIERINPDFYPRPIIQQPSSRPGVKMEWAQRPDDYLTRDDLLKLYKKCAAIMHSGNPYGSQVDYAYYEKMTVHWGIRIMNLLNAHHIRLVDDANLYLIQMGAEGAPPTYQAFEPVEKMGTTGQKGAEGASL